MKAVLVVSGTSSGVGKTTVTVGLMAAFASRGYIVQPFKCGPDFLDGMHHEAAIRAGNLECSKKAIRRRRQHQQEEEEPIVSSSTRKCVNLDPWMMGSPSATIQSFHRHSATADICIIEGCMGLYDSKDGTSDDGSTAQIAKLLGAPVLLVIDGSKMARSVAAMALGYALYDEQVRLGGIVVNKVGGPVHVQWIREAIEKEGGAGGRLKDGGTGKPTMFAGALPNDTAASVPERHLGLTMPSENNDAERFIRLACLVEENLDLDAMLKLGQTTTSRLEQIITMNATPPEIMASPPTPKCRIGIAEDEAFCFYYRDNLHLLRMAGAELIPFSPIRTKHLPPRLDGIYMGGGYPELYAEKLEANASLRRDIRSYSAAGGMIFAECGGFMYLCQKITVSKHESRDMCGVFPIAIRMTPHAKMYYAEIEFSPSPSPKPTNNDHGSCAPVLFPPMGKCRGQRFHYSVVVEEEEDDAIRHDNENDGRTSPLLVTPVLPGAKPEPEGYAVNNTMASYFHLHFTSFVGDTDCNHGGVHPHSEKIMPCTLADHFVRACITTSPY